MKLAILLCSVIQHPYGPYPVRGISGKLHGHAREGVIANRHALAIPYEDWEGGVGLDIMRCCADPLSQWVPLVLVEQEEGDESPENEGKLRETIDALREELQSARSEQEAVTHSTPAEGTSSPGITPGAAPKHLDDAAVALLRTARDLPALEEDRIEKDPETGELTQVHREIAPSVSGSPIESKSADAATGKETTRVPITGMIDVVEEREKIETPGEEASTFAETIAAHAGNASISNQEATTQAADTTAAPPPNADLIAIKDDFRALRAVAQGEGVPAIEAITTPQDMQAAIELHRESTLGNA